MSQATRNIAIIVKDLRRSVLILVFSLLSGCLGFYTVSRQIVAHIQGHLHQKLAFFTVSEPFLAHLAVSLVMTVLVFAPLVAALLWTALARPFNLARAQVFWFTFFSCFLFYSGAAFCYFLTLPFGIGFLLDFQSEQLKAVISIGDFVSFVSIFVLAFGLIFELPIFMVFMAKIKIMSRKIFENNRRYAVLIISVIAALLTPTPDIFNMLLMGLPLYLLYEAGIVAMKILRIH